MKYQEQSFTLPASNPTKTGKNLHGQTWEDIFSPRYTDRYITHLGYCKRCEAVERGVLTIRCHLGALIIKAAK